MTGRDRNAPDQWTWCPNAWAWVSVGLIAFVSLQPLVFGPVRGHDTFAHYFRLAELDVLWRQGVWFSRWSPYLVFGYGYPLYNFYPPLSTSALTLIYRAVGENGPLALNVTFGMALAGGVVGMFLLGRQYYGNLGGLFAAAAYTWSPHVLYQTFERGSLSNAVAMALYPLAALALARAARQVSGRRIALASLLVAALLLSHLTSGLMFLPVLMLVGGLAALRSDRPRQSAQAVAVALMGGLALSAFFWLPAIVQFRYTQYRAVMSAVNYRDHFAQLWYWPGRVVDGTMNPPLPITLGLAQLAMGITVITLSAVKLWRSRHGTRQRVEGDLLAPLGGALGLAMILLTTPLSMPVWETIAILRDMQFPWRWLDASAFLFALTIGWLVHVARPQRFWQVGLVSFSMILMFANALPYLYPPRTHVLPLRPTLADTSAAQRRYDIVGLSSFGEYLPATVKWRPRAPAFPGADENTSLAQKLRRDTLPGGAVLQAAGGPLHAELTLSVPAATALVFETFYYPGWQATVDGQSMTVGSDGTGLLAVWVPAGEHRVTVHFGWTRVRAVADSVSLVTACVLCAVGVLWSRRDRRPAPARVLRCNASARGQGVVLAAVLLGLALAKPAWFDVHDSPLVTHMHAGELADVTRPEWRDFGGELRLVGYTLEGHERLTLYWQAQRTLSRRYAIHLTLTDARGGVVGEIRQPNPGVNSTAYWEAGLLVRDTYRVSVDESHRGDRIALAVRDSETGAPLPLRDSPDGKAQAVLLKPWDSL